MINDYKNRFVVSKVEAWDKYANIRYKTGTIFFIKEAYVHQHNWAHVKFRTTDFADGAFDFELTTHNRLKEIFDLIDDPNSTCENKCYEKIQEKIDSLDQKIEILLKEISSLKSSKINSRLSIEEAEEYTRKDHRVRRVNNDDDPNAMAPWLYDDDN